MTTYRNLLCMSGCSSQSSQAGYMGRNGKNGKHKLSKNVSRMTQEAALLMPHIKSPEITPSFSRKVEINHLLRFYSNKCTYKPRVHLRPSKGGKTQRDNKTPGGPSFDHFGFPPDAKEKKMSRTKQEVLRTIKRMVEENRVIRVRLLSLRQTKRGK